MKKEIIISVLISFCSLTYAQNDTEIYNKIYFDYIKNLKQPNIDYSQGVTVTVLKRPVNISNYDTNDYPRFREKYPKLERNTFNNFIIENRSELHYERVKVKDIKTIMLGYDSVPSPKELASAYSNWIYSIIELSNVGFNEREDQALVYYGFNSGPGVGGGIFLIYEYKRNKWTCKKVIPVWAA